MSWVENKYIECYAIGGGLSEQQARDKFKDTFYEDYNLLSWIITSLFPNTKAVGDDYHFITDDFIHKILVDKSNHDHHGAKRPINEINVGRMTCKLNNCLANITFDMKGFRHGHCSSDFSGVITCYGSYKPFHENVCSIGFSSALMDVYNFAKVSKYYTVVPEGAVQYVG